VKVFHVIILNFVFSRCNNYIPKFHDSLEKDRLKARLLEPKLNPSGCARTEAFKTRNPYDMFGWLASAHRKPPQIKTAEIEAIRYGRPEIHKQRRKN
jgi:hypothetical protein